MSMPSTRPVKPGHPELVARARTGEMVRLRPPRFADFREWRRIRLRDRTHIEPYWASSSQSWDARHTEQEWVQECLQMRVSRSSLGLVIEVDGRFTGQIALYGIDVATRSAELGIWMDATLGRRGIGLLAASLLMDHAFTALGLSRLTAPICVDNIPATLGAERIGFVREATMRSSFDAGGRRKDHTLFAMTVDRVPDGGLAAMWSEPVLPEPEHEPTAHAIPSFGALTATCRFALGSVRRLTPSLPSGRSTTATVGELVLRPVRLLHLPGSLRGRTVCGCVLAGPWQRTSRLAEWSGHAFGYSVEDRGKLVGTVGLEALDVVRFNATLRVESAAVDPHLAILPAAGWLLERAFGLLGMKRVHTGVDPRNDSAVALVKALGLSFEGTMSGIGTPGGGQRDVGLWGIVAEQERGRLDRPIRAGG